LVDSPGITFLFVREWPCTRSEIVSNDAHLSPPDSVCTCGRIPIVLQQVPLGLPTLFRQEQSLRTNPADAPGEILRNRSWQLSCAARKSPPNIPASWIYPCEMSPSAADSIRDPMATKTDFAASDWNTLRDTPYLVGFATLLAGSSGLGTVKELIAL